MIQLKQDAKNSLLKGANKVVDPVKTTMGAEGKTVLIEHQMGLTPTSTKDGVTVCNAVYADNAFEELGAQIVKQACNKTVDQVGDGTSTTAVITQALIEGSLKLSEYSHVEVREGMEKALEDIKNWITVLKKPINAKEMQQIATISANNDEELGTLIANVFSRVGIDSTVEVREGYSKETTVNYVEGIKLDRGFAVPHFCTDFSKGTVELEDALVLIFNGEIKATTDIQDQIREALNANKPLLIIADDVQEAVLASIVKLKMEGTMQVCVSISPEFGINRENVLKDLAIATGATRFDPKYPEKIVLGEAKKVITFKDKTVVLPTDNEDAVSDRIEELKSQLETADKFETEKIKSRISNLKSAIAEIVVGGDSDMDVKEKKDRVDDAVASLRSAMEGGYVSGGGSTLFYISNNLKNKFSGGRAKGYELVREAIRKPFKQILENADIRVAYYFLDRILMNSPIDSRKLKEYGMGVNVKTRKVENMFNSGIIDSAKVTEVALENAVAVTKTVLQTDCLILTKSMS